MKKKILIGTMSLLSLFGLFAFQGNRPVYAQEENLAKIINFDDLEAKNLSATATSVLYDGVIVGDGRVSDTESAEITEGSNYFGMKIPADSDQLRVLVVDVEGYSKIVFDIKLKSNLTQIAFGCDAPITKKGITSDVEILTRGWNEIVMTFSSTAKTAQDFSIDNIRFYTAT